MARVRVPTSISSSHVVSGAMAVHTQCGERDRRRIASSSLRSPSCLALRTMRVLCESGKELSLMRTLTGWLEGCGEPRQCRRTLVGPSRVQHHSEPPESQDHQLVVKRCGILVSPPYMMVSWEHCSGF